MKGIFPGSCLLLVCALLFVACGPPRPFLTATVQGATLSLRTTAGWMNGNTLEGVAGSSGNTCYAVQHLQAMPGDQLMYLALTHLDAQGVQQQVVPQTYQIKPPFGGERFRAEVSVLLYSGEQASRCALSRLVASNGTVTLSKVDTATGTASFSLALDFGADHVSGELDTVTCKSTSDVSSVNLACN